MLPCLSGLSIHDACPTDMPKRDRTEADMDDAERDAKTRREAEEEYEAPKGSGPRYYGMGYWGFEFNEEDEQETFQQCMLLLNWRIVSWAGRQNIAWMI